jgi:hypothetical protein
MEYRLPVNGVQVPGFVQDPEEIDPTQPRTMLPRTRKKSAGGAVTNNVKPEDELGSGRGMLARALQMYSQGPGTAALNELAQQRMREGDSSMLNALAAQFAGSDFEPVQGVLLKRAMAAQEPQKVGNYGLISGGKFVADPYAARDTQAGAMMDIGGELFRDERATEREDRRDARFFAAGKACEAVCGKAGRCCRRSGNCCSKCRRRCGNPDDHHARGAAERGCRPWRQVAEHVEQGV